MATSRYDLDSFQAQSVEKLQIPDFFAPQMTHDTTEYSGIDVAVSRTRLVASAIGVVPQADRFLGSRFEVLTCRFAEFGLRQTS